MGEKQDNAALYNLIQGYQDAIEGRRGEFQGGRESIKSFMQQLEALRTGARPDTEAARSILGQAPGELSKASSSIDLGEGDTSQLRSLFSGMISDPSKRGYDDATVAKMYGKAADVATGAKTNLVQNLNKNAAASGMGSTGAVMRNVMTANEGLSGQLLSAQRDVDLANAEAQRADLWNAAAGLGQTSAASNASAAARGQVAQGMQSTAQTYNQIQGQEDQANQANLALQSQGFNQILGQQEAETNLQGLRSSLYDPMQTAVAQKNKPGFWGTLKSGIAQNLAKGFDPSTWVNAFTGK